MIPEFLDGVNLSPGVHYSTVDEIEQRFGFSPRRVQLMKQLRHLLNSGRHCGFVLMAIGGSFPTAKEAPGDLDILWFTPNGMDKSNVPAGCADLMDDTKAKDIHGCNMMYIPLDPQREGLVEYWVQQLGFDTKTRTDRGMLVLEIT